MALRTADGDWRTAHEFVRETLRRAHPPRRPDRWIPPDPGRSGHAACASARPRFARRCGIWRPRVSSRWIGIAVASSESSTGTTWRRSVRSGKQLEPLAIAAGRCSGITDAQLAEAESVCATRWQRTTDLADWVELNLRFHILFHEATGATRLAAILKGLEEAASVYVAQAQRSHPEIRRRANEAHRALIEACRGRDVEKAKRRHGRPCRRCRSR